MLPGLGRVSEGVKSMAGPSDVWRVGWDRLIGVQARGYEALRNRRQNEGVPSRGQGRNVQALELVVKTRLLQCLGWSGHVGASLFLYVGTCRAQPKGTQTAPTWCPASLTAPSLSHSAMAVESFTATAPFVQIGRFFLSAGKCLAPSDDPLPTQRLCFYSATSQELVPLVHCP